VTLTFGLPLDFKFASYSYSLSSAMFPLN